MGRWQRWLGDLVWKTDHQNEKEKDWNSNDDEGDDEWSSLGKGGEKLPVCLNEWMDVSLNRRGRLPSSDPSVLRWLPAKSGLNLVVLRSHRIGRRRRRILLNRNQQKSAGGLRWWWSCAVVVVIDNVCKKSAKKSHVRVWSEMRNPQRDEMRKWREWMNEWMKTVKTETKKVKS